MDRALVVPEQVISLDLTLIDYKKRSEELGLYPYAVNISGVGLGADENGLP